MGVSLSGREVFEQGLVFFQRGEYNCALNSFELAHAEDPTSATYRSYYGMCLGIATRDFERSTELCRDAAKQEFFNPEQYLNLARVYLAFGFKAEGLRYLRRGLMIDPDHRGIQAELGDLGRRGRPVLTFLPRRHPLNRWLGFARHLIARGEKTPLAA